jgi:pimeloyl-ACP methyl ester carboxylesterase
MKSVMTALAITASLIVGTHAVAQPEKPTVVLVHGAFADASSWNGVVKILEQDGYTVVAAANPLRSVKSDGAAVSALLSSIQSPVVLVGHSYGGNVISAAATQRPVTDAALNEKSGEPAWKKVSSWFIYGDRDKNIPPQAMAFMARRAGAKGVEVVNGASHVVMVSNPEPVARMIEKAAAASASL